MCSSQWYFLVLFMYQSGQVYLYGWLNSLYNAMKWVTVLLSPLLQKREMRFSFVCKVVQGSASNQQSLNVYIQQSRTSPRVLETIKSRL